MKAFTALFLAASAALSAAQATYDPATGEYTCAVAGAAYCAGDSLGTNIIIRCNGTRGVPGNCNNNLVGYPPIGNQPSQCWQSSPVSGDAACAKNCVVYGASGNFNGTFTLPGCTPFYTSTTSLSSTHPNPTIPTASTTVTATTVTETTTTTTDCSTTSLSSTHPNPNPTIPAANSTDCSTTTFVTTHRSSTHPTGGPSWGCNSTTIKPTTYISVTPIISPTATPVGPTKSIPAAPTQYTGAASVKQAAAGVAAAGLVIAYFL